MTSIKTLVTLATSAVLFSCSPSSPSYASTLSDSCDNQSNISVSIKQSIQKNPLFYDSSIERLDNKEPNEFTEAVRKDLLFIKQNLSLSDDEMKYEFFVRCLAE